MSIPKVFVHDSSLGENHFEFPPDRISAIMPVRAALALRSDPNYLVMPSLPASAGYFAVPFVVSPGCGRPIGSVEPGIIPGFRPLHYQLIIGISRVAPKGTVQSFVHAVGLAVE